MIVESRPESECSMGPFVGFTILWLGLNVIPLILGIIEGGRRSCEEPLNRIEYVIPGFQVGCWLGSVPKHE